VATDGRLILYFFVILRLYGSNKSL